MWEMAQFFGSTKKVSKVDKVDSYDLIITRKWLYNQYRIYLYKEGDKNWPNVILGDLKNL